MDIPGIPQQVRENEPSRAVLGRTTVLTISRRVISLAERPVPDGGRELSSGLAVAGGSVVLPGLRAEERLLLGLVDGRLSVARLARLSGLSEDATIRHLQALFNRRVLVPVETSEITIRGRSEEAPYRLGPYEVSSRIGQGGMGSVYACRRTGTVGFQRLFALKVIRQGTGIEHLAERSFAREAQVGSLVDHPNTQSVVDVGTYRNQPYLVLQYIDGISLEEVSFGRPVPPDVLCTVLVDVLRGLQRAHETFDEEGRWLGLVHADVSPQNILIGTDGVARMTDFGSARFTALGESGQADPMNLGKPAFMAPEQATVQPLDARADIFAMGAVMWAALTGQELFSGDSYEQIVTNVLQREIEPPSRFGAPACLDGVCLRALSRPKEGRFVNAEEMAQALIEIGVTNGLLAAPTAVAAFVRREQAGADGERRRRVEFAFQEATAAGAASLTGPTKTSDPSSPVAGKSFAQTMIIPDRRLGARPRERLRRRHRIVLVALGVALGVVVALVIGGVARHATRADRSSASAGLQVIGG
jgi:eukaryotic-like serine/threonine-protein kinase